MTTTSCLPTPIPLQRPWWARWRDDLARWLALRGNPKAERDLYAALGHLSEQTLRDIGAPPWLHERDREAELRRLDRRTW